MRKFINNLKYIFQDRYADNSLPTAKIITYQSEIDYLSKCITESPNIETGGNLFGFWTPMGIPIIHYIIGAGQNAIHDYAHFRQDVKFLEANADALVADHALHHIGSWHSHHSLGLSTPSSGDSASTIEGIRECGLESFLLIIGTCNSGASSARPFIYNINNTCEEARWVVLPGKSPMRTAFESAHPELVYTPTGKSNMQSLNICQLIEKAQPRKVSYHEGYWIDEPEGKKDFSEIVKYLKANFSEVRIFQKEDKTIELRISKGQKSVNIGFPLQFPAVSPTVTILGKSGIYAARDIHWKKEGSIPNSFINFLKQIEL